MVLPERASRVLVWAEQIAVHAVGDHLICGAPHERSLGERGPRELVGEEHRQGYPPEREARQQVARWARHADAVDHGEGPTERCECRVPKVTRSVHEHDVGRELLERPSQRSCGLEIGVTHWKRPYGERLAPESGGDGLIGSERSRGVSPRGEPAREHGEYAARAPPEPTGRQQRDVERARRYRGHRLFARSTSG